MSDMRSPSAPGSQKNETHEAKNDIHSDWLLSLFASLFLWIGLLSGLVIVVLTLDSYAPNTTTIILGIAVSVQAVLIFAILKGFSDIIKLLKVIAGVESPTTTVKTEKSASQIDAQAK